MYQKRLEKINEIEKDLINTYGDVRTISKDALFNYINKNCVVGYSYFTTSYLMNHVNKVLEINENPNNFKLKDFNVELTGEGHITKKDLLTLVKGLDNAQDQFILYGLFTGLYGEQADELRELRVDDIDFANNVIRLGDRDVEIDDLMWDILHHTKKEKMYYVVDNGNLWRTSEYELNTKSKYLIKQRPSTKNQNGTTAMTWNGLRTRVANLMEYLGEDLSIKKIVRSGYVHRLNNEVSVLTVENVKKWLKENNISGTPASFIKICNQLYKK